MSSTAALACKHLDSLRCNPPGSSEFIIALARIDEISYILARDSDARQDLGGRHPEVWNALSESWKELSTRNLDVVLGDSMQRNWSLSVARFTRNLVAGISGNQREAIKFEPDIRAVLHLYTSHLFITNEEDFVAARLLMQTISNIVTANEELLSQLWTGYLTLSEERNVLLRTIVHPDDSTAAVAFIFVANCIAGSPERTRVLIDASMGKRLCVAMLDRLARQVDASDEDEYSDLFTAGWTIFQRLFDDGFSSFLLSLTAMEGEVTNPHRTTLLKLLDSYLIQSSHPFGRAEEGADSQCKRDAVIAQISGALSMNFFDLLDYARSSIRRSLGQSSTFTQSNYSSSVVDVDAPVESLDVLLPKVYEAIVLVTRCFCTMTLMQNDGGDLSEQARRTKDTLIKASPNGICLIENVVDLLRLLDEFLPRIMFGKPTWSTARPDVGLSDRIDHRDDRGFSYVKRDLVRLLGILCHENRAVQDRVRECNGIAVVMNLCVTDDRNPYLREHALFTLRNLLHDNAANQAAVSAIKPLATIDENGVLRDILGSRDGQEET